MIEQQQYRYIPTNLQLNGPIVSFIKTPEDDIVSVGQTGYFTGIATVSFPDQTPANPAVGFATGTISYRWYEIGVGALTDDGNKIIGAATTQLFINDVESPSDSGRQFYLGADYVAIGTSPNANNDTFTSSTATLSVYPEIIINTQPADVTVGAGAEASFSVNASLTDGTYGNLSYQWRIDGENITDGTYETSALGSGGITSVEDQAVLLLPLWNGGSGTSLDLTDYSNNTKSVTLGSIWGDGPTWVVGEGKFYDGAAYFDGNAYLNVPGSQDFNFGTGDFTVELWVKFTSGSNPSPTGPWEVLVNVGNGYYGDGGIWFALLRNGSGGATFYIANTGGYQSIASEVQLNVGTWRHIAVSKQGSTLKMFMDGIEVGTLTDTKPYGSNQLGYIGMEHWSKSHTQGYYFPFCYMQDIRVYKGIAKYTSNFVPSENSITNYNRNSSNFNTSFPSTLAVPFWDKSGSGVADFTDYSTNPKTLTISGNNSWDTSVKKWYTGSVYFSGSDYYSISPTTEFAFGTNDFTIESWVYFTETAWNDIFSTGTYGEGQLSFRKNNTSQLASSPGSNQLEVYYNSTIVASGGALDLNTWHHVAVSRQNGTVRLFINGKVVATGTLTSSISADAPRIGSTKGNQYGMKGYIQDIVVYNDIAKYTEDFVVPSRSIISSEKTYNSISGSKTDTLTVVSSTFGSNVIDCVVSNPNTTSKTTDPANLVVTEARSIIKIESYGTTSTATLLEKNIDQSEFSITSDILNSDDICFYSSEKDLEIELDLYGAKGSDRGSYVGGEGGYSRIQFTMKKNEEYILRGIRSNTALFLYRKGSLIAVVGQGGSAGNAASGGKGGGVNVAGERGDGFRGRGGFGGDLIPIGTIGENGTYGSASTLPLNSIYPEDQKATGTEGGQTIKCSKGVYWRNQGLSSCQDIGNSKFRLSDGTEVTNSASITRGFKSGYNVNRTAGANDTGGGIGGDGATGGDGGDTGQGGGGGGSGYTDGSITIVNTQLGGSTGNTRVNVRLSTGDYYVDSFGRILIFSNTDARNPNTLTQVTGKVLPGTNTCIDDARWQRFIDLARDGTQNYRLTATLDGQTTKITNATDRNIYRMINANNITLRNSLTGWVDTNYAYTFYALAWDETDVGSARGYGSDYSILSWSPRTNYGFGYYGSSSNSFFVSTSTYNNFSANYWILPPGVPDFS